jgi:hypothetical protein
MKKPKVLAYVPLHYGKDYLQYAIASVYHVVDEILILYTPQPSHGHGTSMACPDEEEELEGEAYYNDFDAKIVWQTGTYSREGIHRDTAFDYAKANGFDVVVALDADEVWSTQYLQELIQEVYERRSEKCLIWMRHLWRSFNYICDDPMRQERICYVGPDKTGLIYADKPTNQVWHFGYAREFNQIEYKISIHGHSAEWILPKERWFNEKYKPFPPVQDVHPTCKDTWNPKPFDKNELPEVMRSHTWFNNERIE